MDAPVAHRIERLPAEQEAASSILARRTSAPAQPPVRNLTSPLSSAAAIRCCPASSPATWASAALVRNSGSTRAPGIWLGSSTQPDAGAPGPVGGADVPPALVGRGGA